MSTFVCSDCKKDLIYPSVYKRHLLPNGQCRTNHSFRKSVTGFCNICKKLSYTDTSDPVSKKICQQFMLDEAIRLGNVNSHVLDHKQLCTSHEWYQAGLRQIYVSEMDPEVYRIQNKLLEHHPPIAVLSHETIHGFIIRHANDNLQMKLLFWDFMSTWDANNKTRAGTTPHEDVELAFNTPGFLADHVVWGMTINLRFSHSLLSAHDRKTLKQMTTDEGQPYRSAAHEIQVIIDRILQLGQEHNYHVALRDVRPEDKKKVYAALHTKGAPVPRTDLYFKYGNMVFLIFYLTRNNTSSSSSEGHNNNAVTTNDQKSTTSAIIKTTLVDENTKKKRKTIYVSSPFDEKQIVEIMNYAQSLNWELRRANKEIVQQWCVDRQFNYEKVYQLVARKRRGNWQCNISIDKNVKRQKKNDAVLDATIQLSQLSPPQPLAIAFDTKTTPSLQDMKLKAETLIAKEIEIQEKLKAALKRRQEREELAQLFEKAAQAKQNMVEKAKELACIELEEITFLQSNSTFASI